MRVGFQKRKSLIARILLCCMAITLVLTVQVFAENMSVNDLIGTDLGSSSSTSTQVESGSSSVTPEQAPSAVAPSSGSSEGQSSTGSSSSSSSTAVAGDAYNGIANSSKVDLNNPKAAQATSGLKNIVGVIVSFICYAIVILLTLRVALDLLYVTIPYTRDLLCKQGPNGGGMMAGGMQSPGGFGNSGFGGMSGGYGGGYGGMSGGYGGMQQGAGQQMNGRGVGGIQWVSQAAMRAVAMDTTPGAAFKIYSKDMIVVLVATPILLVLATNGALITLGFKFAGLITGIITKIGGSIG